MERKRTEVDKGKGKFQLASSGNIHSQVITRESMKKEKDGSSLSKAGVASSSNFMGKPKPAESSKPLCSFCNASLEQRSVIKCPKCKALLRLSPRILSRPVQKPVIPKPVRSTGDSVRVAQRRVRVCKICEICCERKETFRNEGCNHSICTDCISKYIQVKVESNSSLILCPGLDCGVALAPANCKQILPEIVTERWEKTIVEKMILDSEKFYCPFKDCSAMLVNDSAEEMRESKCPHCWRLFCVQCRVPWHSGMECKEFQELNADESGRRGDAQLKKLVEEMKWQRCPKCKFYVEKIIGCVRMKCRCKCEFCYRCGATWSMDHAQCKLALAMNLERTYTTSLSFFYLV